MADVRDEVLKLLRGSGIDKSAISDDVVAAVVEEAVKIAPSLTRFIGKRDAGTEITAFLEQSGSVKTALNKLTSHENSDVSVASGKARSAKTSNIA